jgi:hypothetical protein
MFMLYVRPAIKRTKGHEKTASHRRSAVRRYRLVEFDIRIVHRDRFPIAIPATLDDNSLIAIAPIAIIIMITIAIAANSTDAYVVRADALHRILCDGRIEVMRVAAATATIAKRFISCSPLRPMG